METARHRRWISVLALLTVLAATLSIPARIPAALASTPTELRGSTRAVAPAANQPEDEALVKASLQQPIQDEVFYFVMPDRFSNGNPANDAGGDSGSTNADVLRHGYLPTDKGYFHGGDLAGLENKLDYLKAMGISAVWMTPVFKNRAVQGNGTTIAGSSAAYHGYWITDFTHVDPHLGVDADLQTLVTQAHARGMKVFFDIITNHTADVIDYEGGQYAYRNKTNAPYKDADGTVFDDKDFAGTNTFPDLDPDTSFPYKPIFRTPADATIKVPAWLNDPTNYHNRGDSTFAGESSEYGDFFGLDDLFTEQPDVAQGMVDIYKQWITTYGIDGYRIDTVKHVNIEFWQKFGPEILAHAQAVGKPDFFMYGEVFSGDVPFLSRYTTEGRLPAVLDFGFQDNARGFASSSGATNNLKNFFEADDYYTDADSNAYSLPTFIGNHDIGRFGYFLRLDNAGASDSELLARDQLAHALMFFSRGMPVVYYGDEQGFTGDGGDKDAREDMFPSAVASYNDNDLIGTDATTADDNFDTDHPLYQAITSYSQVRAANKALRRGAQIQRYSTDAAGIFAFSRIERDEKIEYVVAFNNAETEQTATFKVYQPNTSFTAVLPSGAPALTSSAQSEITVTVPALGLRIYKAATAVPTSTAAPSITMAAPVEAAEVTGRFEVAATLGSDQLAEVTFAVKAGDATEYTVIGTDTNAPYRVFYDASKLAEGTALVFKAIVNDLSGTGVIGNLRSATVGALVGSDGPAPGTCPAPTYAVIHYQRPDNNYTGWGLHLWGDAIDPGEATEWASPKAFNGQDEFGMFAFIKLADASQPLNFIIHKGDEKDTPNDRSFVPGDSPQIWVKAGDATNYTSAAAAQGSVTIHYQRPGDDYDGWGLHLFGDAIDPSEATEWTTPKLFTGAGSGEDAFGRFVTVKLQDPTKAVEFIVHKGDEKDTPDDRSFVPAASSTGNIWLKQGDTTVYTSQAAAQNVVRIHYHRPAGDYGDYTSTDYTTYWSLYVWTGSLTKPTWETSFKPTGTDAFGVFWDVALEDNATVLNYIIHKGGEKDLPEDQELDLAKFGNEVWVLQATPGYLLPMLPCDAACKPSYPYAVIHYQRPDNNYTGWGLHLWGDAIDPGEATEWASPKAFNGQDEFGMFAFIKLADASQPLNFIIHKGDEKDTPNDRSFVPGDSPQIWVKAGDATNYTSAAAAQGSVTIHYQRPGDDYDGWGLHLFGDAIDPSEATEWTTPKLFTGAGSGEDAFGRFVTVKLQDPTKAVEFIVHKGDEKDTPDDRSFVPAASSTGRVWLKQGDATVYASRAAAQNLAIIHYHRTAGDYGDSTSTNAADYWGLHVWTGAATGTDWTAPLKPAGTDAFGIYFEVPLADGATTLNYILHKGDEKDLPEDQELDLAKFGNEVWVLQATPGYLLPLKAGCPPPGPDHTGDLSKQKAHWLSRDTIAWDIAANPAYTYTLHYDASAGIALDSSGKVSGGQAITLALDATGLSAGLKAKFPHLADFTALKIDQEDQILIQQILTGMGVVSATDASGKQIDATGLQIPGVLDDLYTYNGTLGVTFDGDVPAIRLWAPTAKSVKLHLFADSNPATTSTVLAMTVDPVSGVWSISGAADWLNKYYLFEVEVYVPSTRMIERNLVTDPYSLSLATNSTRSQIVNLATASLKPAGWDTLTKPSLTAPEDIVLYELHIRDFSINDLTVPEAHRGTYLAFAADTSNGNRHLRALAESGLTHIHLLPTFDIATINENKAERQEPDAALLSTYPPTSTLQQAAVAAVADQDGFNWGYDPYHYTTPEGSYSTNPDGTTRIVEFRDMVKALGENGLRVVMDVVYNHTTASGQAARSVLDRVVPGYYQRLNLEGGVETSTCCANTATEHAMMEKLMLDSIVTWAREYKVDGFRFDLMGHHMKVNMERVRDALAALTLAKDGVDGSKIYIYGEGWNFGEVENNKRGTNATQLNMPGTGIGTFNDRLRDAARGGGPFSGFEEQGFITGLAYDPNATDQGTTVTQTNKLLLSQDQIRIGLAGNLRDYIITDRNGNIVPGKDVSYNGQPTGYAADPQETINYVEAHDNETLWDAIALKAPASATLADRVRMQNLGNSLIALTQGIPFFQAGQDMLRSKSLDRNSYNSGDWFNKLDFTYTSNNWGVGLPRTDNQTHWPVMAERLGNPALKPSKADIEMAVAHFREMLEIRKSSKLFRLESSTAISEHLTFLNTGPNQIPGLIVMRLSDLGTDDLDPSLENIVVLFNANDEAQTFTMPAPALANLHLHTVQLHSIDPLLRSISGTTYNGATGTFTIPPRTTAVFTDEMLKTYFPVLRR